jgi:hypothetical protein
LDVLDVSRGIGILAFTTSHQKPQNKSDKESFIFDFHIYSYVFNMITQKAVLYLVLVACSVVVTALVQRYETNGRLSSVHCQYKRAGDPMHCKTPSECEYLHSQASNGGGARVVGGDDNGALSINGEGKGHPGRSMRKSCVFHDVCFNYSSGGWLFFHDGLGSALPMRTRVNRQSRVNAPSAESSTPVSGVFLGWPVDINTGTTDPRGRRKRRPYYFRPQEVVGSLPMESRDVIYESRVHALFASTPSSENVGHVIWDSYLALIQQIDLWVGLEFAFGGGNGKVENNGVVVVDVKDKDVFWVRGGAAKQTARKLQREIGRLIFPSPGGLIHLSELTGSSAQGSTSLKCFDTLLVGNGGPTSSGQFGGLFESPRSLRYIKTVLRKAYPSPLPRSPPPGYKKTLTLLFFEKTRSNHLNNNVIENWGEMVSSINTSITKGWATKGVYIRIVAVRPAQLGVAKQISLLGEADIIVCQWGGVSMLNFMLKANGVQVTTIFSFSHRQTQILMRA